MTTRQRLRLSMLAVAINRPDRVDHVLCCQMSAGRDHYLSCSQSSDHGDDLTALSKDRRTTRVVNRAIDATTTEKRRVRRIHNCVSSFLRNVGGTVNLNHLAIFKQKPHMKGREISLCAPPCPLWLKILN